MYKSRYREVSKSKKGRKAGKFFVSFLKISLLLGFLLAIIAVLRLEPLQIRQVQVSGQVDIDKKEIISLAQNHLSGNFLLLIPKSNFLLLRTKPLKAEVASWPRVREVNIDKSWDQVLHINIVERQKDFVWCRLAECFLMDGEGLIFARALPEEVLGRIVWRGGIEGEPTLNKFPFIEDYLRGLESLQKAGFKVLEVVAELPDKAVFKTEIGDIFLNPQENISLVVPNVFLLVQEIRGEDPEAYFEYIDARFGAKLFYKVVE